MSFGVKTSAPFRVRRMALMGLLISLGCFGWLGRQPVRADSRSVVPAMVTFNPTNVTELVAAITAANSAGQPVIINLVAGQTYTVTTTDHNSSPAGNIGLPKFSGTLPATTVNGNGAIIEIAPGAPFSTLIEVESATNLNLNNIVFRGNGGGGALFTRFGTPVLNDCTLTGFQSAALTNFAVSVRANRCTFTGNQKCVSLVNFSGLGAQFFGTNCTFSGNFPGAALSCGQGCSFDLKNCTFTGGTAPSVSISTTAGGATCRIRNCIFDGASPQFVVQQGASFVSDGNNLFRDTASNLFTLQPTDQTNTPAQLGPLANNGGPTQTYLPLVGSPAIDKGSFISGITTDQRGQARPFDFSNVANAAGGDGSDIGAVEVQPADQGGPVAVNSLVTLTITSSTLTSPSCSPTYANDYVVVATLTNVSTQTITTPTFQLLELQAASGAPPAVPFRLLTADGATCGSGGLPNAIQSTDGATPTPATLPTLAPGQSVTVRFVIAMPSIRRFRFVLNALGVPGASRPEATADQRPAPAARKK